MDSSHSNACANSGYQALSSRRVGLGTRLVFGITVIIAKNTPHTKYTGIQYRYS